MKMHPMVSMEMDDEEIHEAPTPIPIEDKPSYPYGLRICLTDAELRKLGLDPAEALDGVGGLVHLFALARITSASMDQREGGDPCIRVELQIEDLAVESEDEENEEALPPKKRLAYASMK